MSKTNKSILTYKNEFVVQYINPWEDILNHIYFINSKQTSPSPSCHFHVCKRFFFSGTENNHEVSRLYQPAWRALLWSDCLAHWEMMLLTFIAAAHPSLTHLLFALCFIERDESVFPFYCPWLTLLPQRYIHQTAPAAPLMKWSMWPDAGAKRTAQSQILNFSL